MNGCRNPMLELLSPTLSISCKTRKPSIEAGIRRNAICYSTWNEIWTLEIQPQPCRSSCLAEAVLVIMLRRAIKRRLISLSPSSESLAPSSDSLLNPTKTFDMLLPTLPCTAVILSAILEFVIGFVSNFYTHVRCHYAQFSEKNEVSILINGWVTANYSASQSPFCPPSWNL